MEVQNNCSSLDEFVILKTLGQGYHATVKKGVDKDGNQVAIKRYRLETASLNTLRKQIDIMQNLNHENIVKLVAARDKATYRTRKGETYNCLAIILEFQAGGQLFNYIAKTGKFSEPVTRTYFNQMMNGLYYLHKMGFAHRDIKPENILLSKDFVLKLADFGFSAHIEGKDNSGVLHTNLGSEGYKAPQIAKLNYTGSQIDVFAAGVILFIMLKGAPPFSSSDPSDKVYALIKEKNYKHFWAMHCKRNPQLFNDKFKDLFIRMVAYNPKERPTIEEISQHPWVQGTVCTHSQIILEFTERKRKIQESQDEFLAIEEQKKQQRMNFLNQQGMNRGSQTTEIKFFETYISEKNKNRKLAEGCEVSTPDGFKVNEKIDYFLASLKAMTEKQIPLDNDINEEELLVDNEEEDKLSLKLTAIKEINEKNEIQLTYQCEEVFEEDLKLNSNITVQISLGADKEKNIVVNVKKIHGEHLYYKKIANQIRKNFLYCLV